MQHKNLFIFLGIFFGICIAFDLWVVYFLALTVLVALLIQRCFKKEETGFLTKLFLISFALRVFVVLILRPLVLAYGNGLDIFGDGMAQGLNGFILAESIRHDLTQIGPRNILNQQILELIPHAHALKWQILSALPPWTGRLPPVYTFQVSGFGYFLTLVYYFFGFKILFTTFLNCLCGATLPVVVYAITKRISVNKSIARTAAILTAFFPSLFLWSISNQKEIDIIFLSFLLILLVIKLLTERSFICIILIPVLSYLLFLLRWDFVFPMFIFYLISFLFMLIFWLKRNKIILFAVITFILFALFFPHTHKLLINKSTMLVKKVHQNLVVALAHHKHQIMQNGNNNYRLLSSSYYRRGARDCEMNDMSFGSIFTSYYLSVIHFVFEPFPYRTASFLSFVAYPQTILVYSLLVFSLLGIVAALRKRIQVFLILFSFLFIFSSIVALSEGNVGGLIRHRDIITPLFNIFAAIGLINFLNFLKFRNSPIK